MRSDSPSGPTSATLSDAPPLDGWGSSLASTAELGAEDPPTGIPAVEDIPDELLGSELGQYRLLRALGQGSMGRVYEGEHLGLLRSCALKVLHPALVASQPKVRDLFWAEARAVALLVHPHVVGISNVGRDRGYDFLEMELVAGGDSLKRRVVRHGAQEPADAVRWAWEVAQALECAHEQGLIHRDVKPNNVLLSSEGKAKLADFGLVRRLRDDGPAPISGTPAFMAPELFAGSRASPQSDIYALGITLFYLLSARLPFAAPNISELIRLHRLALPPDLATLAPDVPEALAAIIRRCLAKRPGDRFARVGELADALRMVLFGLRDIDDLVADALRGIDGLSLQGGRGQIRVVCRVPGDRIQEVYLETVESQCHHRVLSIYSLCAPAEPRHYEYALRLNGELCHGGLSLREIDGVSHFVMGRSFPLERVTPEEVRLTVREIARRADAVEARLTGHDLF